ncbi:MAG: hypothetical protein GY756_03325 [bacterium]|nr:hypothetical protein [bacterium]
MRNIILLLFLTLSAQISYAQSRCDDFEEIPVVLYETSEDFMNKIRLDVEATAILYEKSDKHLDIKKIFNKNTGKKIKNFKSVWAIKYNNEKYFNLLYSDNLKQKRVFVKFDIIGKYCAVFINKDTPKIVLKGGGKALALFFGLSGALANEIIKDFSGYKDENGNRLLFIDTTKIEEGLGYRYSSSLGNFLNKKELKELTIDIPELLEKVNSKEITFEEVVDLINSLNGE